MKILWHSVAPFVGTGYGQQTAMFCPRIRDAGHDLAISATFGVQGSTLEWEGLHLYPGDHTGFGKALLPYYVGHHAAGEVDPREVLVITLMDVWALTSKALSELRLASWTPIDHYPVPPRVAEFFATTGARPIAMSRFGEQALREAGLDPLYVPHAVDTSVFKPLGDKAEIRAGMGVPEDAFVVGMVANNQGVAPPRKAFPQVFQAFAEFHRRHADAVLYLHSDVFGHAGGLNLMALAATCGIPTEALATSNQLNLHLGIPAPIMAQIFNGFDVLASPSYGEGFGIPIVEAQACGVPVIVTDWTAMPELVGAGWKVQGDRFYDPPHGAFYMCPSVIEILDALEAAYDSRGDKALAATAREFALGYDVETVMEQHWLPTLAALDRPREVAPLNGNRAQRRAAAKAGVAA